MSANLRLGVATVAITPTIGTSLIGYQPRVSTGIDAALTAEALVCRMDDQAWALVSTDLLGVSREFTAAVRAGIVRRCPLRADAIMISASHTHSGPSALGVATANLDAGDLDGCYKRDLVAKLVDLVVVAYENAVPGSLARSWGTVDDLAHNRRVRRADGTWGNEWTDAEGRHPGVIDPHLEVVAVRDGQGRTRALLVNYACHPVVLGPGSLVISPDYVGHLKATLRATCGVDHVLFCLAGAANLNPRHCVQADAAGAREMGEALAGKVRERLAELEPLTPASPGFRLRPWTFLRNIPVQEGKPWKELDGRIESEFQVLTCGDFAVVAVPGELFCEFNPRIRAASDHRCTVVASMANAYIGYLPTDAALAEGAYEAKAAPASGLEAQILAACADLLSASRRSALSAPCSPGPPPG